MAGGMVSDPVSRAAATGLLRDKAFVGGGWVKAASGRQFAVTNPANGETIATVSDLDGGDAERAIEVAHEAFGHWRGHPPARRSEILRRWSRLILEQADVLASILTMEQGKPLAEAKGEVESAARMVEWAAEEGRRIYGELIPASDRRFLVTKEPVGVVAAITPWNFPAAMVMRKCAPALAAGCAVVVKPAEATPLTALALAELSLRAGLPGGVFNVLTTNDPAAVGLALTASGKVRKLSFTGSTEIGKLLMRHSADTVKRISLELGGNAPYIVFDDADLDAAVQGALFTKFRNAGQMCISANRILVQEPVYEVFAGRLAEAAARLKPGNGLDPGTDYGPLIDRAAVAKVEAIVEDAVALGGRLLVGGNRLNLGANFFAATVVAEATTVMRCAKEEIFGPVAPLFRFAREEEAIRMANDTSAGLISYFYTSDHRRVWRVQQALEAGMVAVNVPSALSEAVPFGGVKESGIGREGGKYGIEEYLELKLVCIGETAGGQ